MELKKVKRLSDVCPSNSLLIVGAGSSALNYSDLRLREKYDVVVTLNNALSIANDADYYSIEINKLSQMDELIPSFVARNYEKVLFKKHALSRLFKNGKEGDFYKKLNDLSFYGPPAVMHALLPSARLNGCLRLIAARFFTSSNVQWCGSLSLWLDVAIKSGVKDIGLIGTDFGGGYAKCPSWLTSEVSTHSLAKTSANKNFNFFSIAYSLKKLGYFKDVRFHHYHNSSQLSSLLN